MPKRKPKVTAKLDVPKVTPDVVTAQVFGERCEQVSAMTAELRSCQRSEEPAVIARLQAAMAALRTSVLLPADVLSRVRRNQKLSAAAVLIEAIAADRGPLYTVDGFAVLERGRFLFAISRMTDKHGPALTSGVAAQLRAHIVTLLNACPFTPDPK